MEYARIAARHFHAEHHEYYVTPDDLLQSIPMIAAAYDQPFGNSSVVPAYYCARMAKEAGIEHMLAGDGGDELFGGNTRYAWQRVFSFYEHIPEPLRRSVLEPSLLGWPMLARIPVVKKAVGYVDQARVPLPDRLQRYNLLTRIGLAEILTPEFLAAVDTEEPLRQQQRVYGACNASSIDQQDAGLRLEIHARGQRSSQGRRRRFTRRNIGGIPVSGRSTWSISRSGWNLHSSSRG